MDTDLLTDYQINAKRSHKNLKNTIIDGALEPWFRGRRMASLTTADIRTYVAERQEKGYANATINRELSALKRMFTLAIQAGKLLQRPHIPMLAENNVRKGFFERAQFIQARARNVAMAQPGAAFETWSCARRTTSVSPASVTDASPSRVNCIT